MENGVKDGLELAWKVRRMMDSKIISRHTTPEGAIESAQDYSDKTGYDTDVIHQVKMDGKWDTTLEATIEPSEEVF